MTDLEAALDIAVRLRAAIACEVESARDERRLLRTLDSAGLFARATHRSAFVAEVGRLERMLSASLHHAVSGGRMAGTAVEELRASAPGPGPALAEVLSEIRSLAGALHEIDRLNAELARRALAIVGCYVDALQPTPGTYDRLGARSRAPARALVEAKG